METRKIEEQFRDKLNSREINPSSQSWERLEAKLTGAEEKKAKFSFGWLHVAASILVLMVIGIFFFTQKSTDVMVSPISTVDINVKNDSTQNQMKKSRLVASPKEKKSDISNERIVAKKFVPYQNTAIAENNNLPVVEDEKKDSFLSDEVSKSDEKLIEGAGKIALNEILEESNVKVDRRNLLLQVEGELNVSFRERVFEKVSKKYKKAKEFVVNNITR